MAKRFNLAGKDDIEEALVSMYADQVADLQSELGKAHFEKDEARKAQLTERLHGEVVPNNMKLFETRLSQSGSGYFASSGLTYADIFLFSVLEYFGDKRVPLLEVFPHIKKLDENLRAHPKLAAYLAKRPAGDL